MGSPSLKPFTRLAQNLAYLFNIFCFLLLRIGGGSAWHGGWNPCRLWKLHPAVGSTSLKPFKHAWHKIGPISLNKFVVFGDWWSFCFAWWVESLSLVETTPRSGLYKPQALQILAQRRAYVFKLFAFEDWWGFCLAWWVESLSLVETTPSSGLYKPQTLQTNMLGTKSGLFLKHSLYFCLWG